MGPASKNEVGTRYRYEPLGALQQGRERGGLLEEVFAKRGTPEHLRSENEPEFIARAMRQHLEKSGVSTFYLKPGAPWENGFAESFNSRFRDEFLGCEEFTRSRLGR